MEGRYDSTVQLYGTTTSRHLWRVGMTQQQQLSGTSGRLWRVGMTQQLAMWY